MRYKLTKETLPQVNELCHLIAKTRTSLADLGTEAQRDWDRLQHRFPSNDDLYQGFISLSERELKELHANLLRFCDATRQPVPLRPRASRVFDLPLQTAA